MGETSSTYEAWRWQQFLEQLDKAGYAIVKKPTTDKLGKQANVASGI